MLLLLVLCDEVEVAAIALVSGEEPTDNMRVLNDVTGTVVVIASVLLCIPTEETGSGKIF